MPHNPSFPKRQAVNSEKERKDGKVEKEKRRGMEEHVGKDRGGEGREEGGGGEMVESERGMVVRKRTGMLREGER